jgi:cytochrome d ubiquinol oxidase subunit I
MEGQFKTEKGAPLTIGGIPDEKSRTTEFGIKIPKALSFLAFGDFDAEVKGLEEFPEENWPPVLIVHLAFQVMVGCGTILAALGLLFWIFQWKWKNLLEHKWFLMAVVIATPLGFIAVEAGWIVTEVGRQPWVIYEIMRTIDSVTPVPGQVFHLSAFTLVYALLSIVAVWLMNRQIKALHRFGKEQSSKGEAEA